MCIKLQCEKVIYTNKVTVNRTLPAGEPKAIENRKWTGTHFQSLGGHLETESRVAFSLPLTGRLSFSSPSISLLCAPD